MYKVDSIWTDKTNRRIAMLVGMAGAFFLIQMYVFCYRIKTPWYSNNFLPPDKYTKGPIMRD